jgi:hypothetical protein
MCVPDEHRQSFFIVLRSREYVSHAPSSMIAVYRVRPVKYDRHARVSRVCDERLTLVLVCVRLAAVSS